MIEFRFETQRQKQKGLSGIEIKEKKCKNNPTNHGFLGTWANELHAHLLNFYY